MSRPQRNSSHRTFSSSNYVSRSTAHEAEGRLRIDFNAPKFSGWRELWGQNVFFRSLEYRKQRSFPEHEFVLLRDFFMDADDSVPTYTYETHAHDPNSRALGLPEILSRGVVQSSKSVTSTLQSLNPSNHLDQPWFFAIPEDIHHEGKEYVLKLERQANPETQFNSAHRTEAYDFIDFKSFQDLDIKDRSSTVELDMTFPKAMPLEEAIKICASVSQHQDAQQYTLRQFNCFFFSWSITAMLIQSYVCVSWVRALRTDAEETAQYITMRIAELSNPRRIWGEGPEPDLNAEVRPNLALLLAGECNYNENQRPFFRKFSSNLTKLSTFSNIASSLLDQSNRPLWSCDQLEIIRKEVRRLLNNVSDSTIGLATAGTGQSDMTALLWGDTTIPLNDEWDARVKTEVGRLLALYIQRMWPAFREALQQTAQAERRPTPQATPARLTLASLEQFIQRIGNSPAVLGPRLTGLGMRTAWNGAGVAASAHLSDTQGQSLPRTMRRLQYTPGQVMEVLRIGVPFLELVATRRERAREHQGEGAHPTSLDTLSVLRMMGNISFGPEREDEIVLELERSVKSMARYSQQSNSGVQELRMATLELLNRLNKTGMEINFSPDPTELWRICLWYCLSEETIRAITLVPEMGSGSDRRIDCWFRNLDDIPRTMAGRKQPMQSSKILEFIQGRIAELSKMPHNFGTAAECRREIENVMTKIWQAIPLEAEG